MFFNSPFHDHLRTNYVPSGIDVSHVQQLLLEPEAGLVRLNNRLSHLKRQLDNMKTERDDLKDSIDEHYRLLAPFRCLPDDMLREIFIWCLPGDHQATMSAEEPPLTLGRVCKRWRFVVYHTPRLWASLHVGLPVAPSFERALSSPPMPPEIREKATLELEARVQLHQRAISEWLDRSGSCPLSISIHPQPNNRIQRYTKVQSYINLILTFAHRMGSLDITVPHGDLSGLLASIPFTAFPVLRVLRLRFSRREYHDPQWRNGGLLNAKQLSVLKLSYFPHHISATEVDWSQLTYLAFSEDGSLYGQRVNIQDAQKIFTRCTRLIYCSVSIFDTRTDMAISTPLSLPYLQTLLIIDGSTWSTLANLFEFLDTPSLRAISYHSMSWPTSTRHTPLIVLLSRNSTHVERLTTDIQYYTLEDLALCLKLVPFLTHFAIEACRLGPTEEQAINRPYLPVMPKVMKAALNLLTPDDRNSPYCRHLHVLNLNLKHISLRLSDIDLLNFIQQRMKAAEAFESDVAILTEVTFTSPDEMELDIRPFLQQYIEDGMKLDLNYRPPIPLSITSGFFSPYNGVVKRPENAGIFHV